MLNVNFGVAGSQELDAARDERLRRALDAKVPKLLDTSEDLGAQALLVLENRDVSATSPEDVLASIRRLDSDQLPDLIIYLESAFEPPSPGTANAGAEPACRYSFLLRADGEWLDLPERLAG